MCVCVTIIYYLIEYIFFLCLKQSSCKNTFYRYIELICDSAAAWLKKIPYHWTLHNTNNIPCTGGPAQYLSRNVGSLSFDEFNKIDRKSLDI